MMVTIKKGTEHTEEFQPKPDQSGLLTDEQVKEIVQKLHNDMFPEIASPLQEWRAIAEYYEARIEALIDFMNGKCTEHWVNSTPFRWRCKECWEALKATQKEKEG